jgi:hypothetical protein
MHTSYDKREDANMERKPTIYEALRAKLGREPTSAELKADMQRISDESLVERAARGKLRHQRGAA